MGRKLYVLILRQQMSQNGVDGLERVQRIQQDYVGLRLCQLIFKMNSWYSKSAINIKQPFFLFYHHRFTALIFTY